MPSSDSRSRPRVLSSALAALAGVVAVGLLATTDAQRWPLLVELAGLFLVWGGIETARRGPRLLGGLATLAGVATSLFALGLGVVGVSTFSARAELLPGMVGLLVLVLGLADVRDGWARRLVTTGTALLLVGVVTSGIVYGAAPTSLLAATAATVVAWDLGEQAINVSEHVGRAARGRWVELAHGGAGAVVGGFSVVAALAIQGVNLGGATFGGLVVLLGAAVLLVVALYN